MPNPNFTIFSGNYFGKALNCHISSTVRAFELIPKLRGRPECKLFSGTKYISVILCDSHQHYLDIETTQWTSIEHHKIQIYEMVLVAIWSTDVLPYGHIKV